MVHLRTTTLIAISLLSFGVTSTTYAETLQETLKNVSDTNPTLREAFSQVQEQEAFKKQSQANFIPDITARGTYTHTTLDQEGTDTDNNQRNLTIEARQALFSGGGTLYGFKAAQANLSAEKFTYQATAQDIYIQTIIAYTTLLTAQEVVDLQKQQVALLTEQLKATREEFKQGEVTQTDVKQAEARLSAAKANLVDAQGTLHTQESALTALVGETVTDLSWPKALPEKDLPQALEEATAQALAQHPLLLAAEKKHSWRAALKKQARQDYFPQLDAVASHANIDADDTKGYRDNRLGLELSWKLFTGGYTKNTVKAATAREKAAEESYYQSRRAVVETATTSFHQHQTAKALMIARQTEVEATTIATQGVEKEHALGERSVLDLLDARQELLEAKVNLVRARNTLLTSAYALLAAIGELNTYLFKGTA